MFAGLAVDDAGVAGAAPYAVMALLSVLYLIRPMFALWAPVFAAFVVYASLVLVNPLVDSANGPWTDWLIFLALGIMPAIVLWLARPTTPASSESDRETPVVGTRK